MAREIALSPTPRRARARRDGARRSRSPRLRGAGLRGARPGGRDADEALDLARQAVADGVESLVVVGGDGMVHLGVQAVAETGDRLGIIPAGTGNDVARYFDLPRKDPVGRRRPRDRRHAAHRSTWPAAARSTSSTVLAAGFDAIVNERANG